jgi:hypothetical protein
MISEALETNEEDMKYWRIKEGQMRTTEKEQLRNKAETQMGTEKNALRIVETPHAGAFSSSLDFSVLVGVFSSLFCQLVSVQLYIRILFCFVSQIQFRGPSAPPQSTAKLCFKGWIRPCP